MEGKTQIHTNPSFRSEHPAEEADPVELSLGLSLNGRFGVDPARHDRKRKRRTEMQMNGKIEGRNDHNYKKVLLEMPSVCTQVGRRRIEGFLYRYRKGEEVKIVCVCHGSFLSPAEFVEHGGGGGGGVLNNPLKHIVVNPFPIF